MDAITRWKCGAVALSLAGVIAGYPASAGATRTVADGTITRLGTVPNYYYDRFGGEPLTRQTGAFGDQANGYFYEYNGLYCPSLVRMDLDSLNVVATSDRRATGSCQNQPDIIPYGTGGAQANLSVDSTDHLLLGITQGSHVVVAKEETLDQVATWALPAPGNNVRYTSWFERGDELLVLSDSSNGLGIPSPLPTVAVTALSIPMSLGANAPVVLWSASISQCQASLSATYAGAAAYHATKENAVYVPCIIDTTTVQRAGIVKLELGPHQQGGTACAQPATECWTGKSTVTPIPQSVNDVLFEPGSDRLLLPSQVSAIVYDGHGGVLEGRTAIGTPTDSNKLALGLDRATGRMYSMSKGAGLMVIEARRTPVAPGYKFLQYASAPFINTFPVMAADAAFPYRRLIIPHPDPAQNTDVPVNFEVFADTLPVGADPPASAVDVNTFNGVTPPGSTKSSVFSGSARGYGFHSDYVGGVSAVVTNSPASHANVVPIPFTSTTDLLGASVRRLTYGIGSREGDASAMADAGTGTAYQYSQCTGLASLTGCVPLPCPVTTCVPPRPPPSTSQRWPYPDAACYQPGANAQETNSVSGTYVTDSSGSQRTTGGSDATADADCSGANGRVVGDAVLRAVSQQDQSLTLPQVSVEDSEITSTVTHLDGGAGVVSETLAEAHGVRIGVPGGPIEIGGITQHAKVIAAGTPGTAKVVDDTVTVSNMVVAGQELCATTCTQHDFERLNQMFPTYFYAFRPTPDERYNDPETHLGSPGGYLAVVQANLSEQYGDQQFNGMSAEESTYLPAVRIVLYGRNEGNPQINREVLDLAGVEADAEYGIQVIPGGSGYQPDNVQNAAQQAGVPTGAQLIPTHMSAAPPPTVQDLIRKTITQLVEGILWLARNPAQALEMGIFLAVLGLPLAMTRRRWTWPGTTREQIA